VAIVASSIPVGISIRRRLQERHPAFKVAHDANSRQCFHITAPLFDCQQYEAVITAALAAREYSVDGVIQLFELRDQRHGINHGMQLLGILEGTGEMIPLMPPDTAVGQAEASR
jgi:hypothetical protein